MTKIERTPRWDSMGPIAIYRISRWLLLRRVPILPRALKAINYLLFNCVIPPECTIGPGTRVFHSGLGVIIHPSTIIGARCSIYNHVVIGGGHDTPDGPPIRVEIGDECTIAAGAKVLCKADRLRIGRNSTVGANAVVLSDVPDNVVVGGIPARVLKTKEFLSVNRSKVDP